jgi:hypothetical protein
VVKTYLDFKILSRDILDYSKKFDNGTIACNVQLMHVYYIILGFFGLVYYFSFFFRQDIILVINIGYRQLKEKIDNDVRECKMVKTVSPNNRPVV